MVLRRETLFQRLGKLEEVIAGLESLQSSATRATERPPGWEWSVERGLQLGAEILFDVGNYILGAHFGVQAESYEDILEQLARHGVLDTPLRLRLRGLGGFRNVLVHGYMRLDRERVAEGPRQGPQDFNDFAQAVTRWLHGLPGAS